MEQPPKNPIQQDSPEKRAGDSRERTLANYLHGKEKESVWELPTNIDVISLAVDELEGRLQAAGWRDEAITLSEALREALINAIAHGNLGIGEIQENEDISTLVTEKLKNQRTNKKVTVILEISSSKVKVVVRDEGNGFDWRHIPSPIAEENLLKTHGRGILIMREFLAKIGCTADFNEKGNEVTMELDRGKNS